MKISIKQYKQEGMLSNLYSPLHNLVTKDGEIVDFQTKKIDIDVSHPLDIECQPSYDGTVNLIINDDKNPPRIVNTRFSKTENDRFRIINRNQVEQSNLYHEDMIDSETRLCRVTNTFAKFDLIDTPDSGQLSGGTYTFYMQYLDEDYNNTAVVAESGQIPIFHGTYKNIKTVSGTILNERTSKAIHLRISNIDTTFNKIKLLYSREFSTENGIRMSEVNSLIKEYDITAPTMDVVVTGFEDTEVCSAEDINVVYDAVNNVKTQTQVQNLLFFGNVDKDTRKAKDLQTLSYYIKVTLKQDEDGIGYITPTYDKSDKYDLERVEYYNPKNVYYKLGYWPEEMYRLGIVYILNDDTQTEAFNLRGCVFKNVGETNNVNIDELFTDGKINYLQENTFISPGSYDNTYGVFKNPDVEVIDDEDKKVQPLYYEFDIHEDVKKQLKSLGIKGFFFVRQKRIPTILCQALTMGINKDSYIPMPYVNNTYIGEGFYNRINGGEKTPWGGKIVTCAFDALNAKEDNKDGADEYDTTHSFALSKSIEKRIYKTNNRKGTGLLSLDAIVNPILRTQFNGGEFVIDGKKQCYLTRKDRQLICDTNSNGNPLHSYKAKAMIIDEETPIRMIDDYCFSTKAGDAASVMDVKFFDKEVADAITITDRKEDKKKNPQIGGNPQ